MSRQPDPWPSLMARLKKVEDALRRIGNASPFFGTGIHPDGEGGMTVEGKLNVTSGEVQSGDYSPATSGWHLGSDGKAEFKDVILYDIPNSMLANPLLPARLHADAQNFQLVPLSTAWTTVATTSITVPAGYTQALILNLAAGVTAYNNTANVDFLYIRTRVNGVGPGGWSIGSVDVDASGTGVSYDLRTELLTGLAPGSTLTFSAQVATAFGTWAASNSNVMNLDVVLLWLR